MGERLYNYYNKIKSFRNPKYLERYEDVVFDLEQASEVEPANNAHQNKTGLRFVADNTGETTPFDWHNARFSVDFKVNQLAAGADTDADGVNMGMVNGSSSLTEKLTILANGRDVYSCNYANHVVNIKNLLEYNPSYAESVATNEFYYLYTSRNAERSKFTVRRVTHRQNAAGNADEAGNMLDEVVANYNKGFSIRKVILGDSATVRYEIPLNRYSFFETLEDKLLPNTKIELNLEIERDSNLIWRDGGADCRVILTRLQLFVPRLTFNSEGQKLYMENYLKPYKWTYLNEVVERSNNTQQQTGHFRITNAISKPRHEYGVKLTDGQKSKLASAIRNKSPLTLRLKHSQLSGSDELMLTRRQISKIKKSLAAGTGSDIR